MQPWGRKYRTILSAGNGILAIGLFFWGQSELWSAFRSPGRHLGGVDPRFIIAPAQRASYCWNFPAFILSGGVRLSTGAHIYLSQRFLLLYSDVAYFVFVAAFWWWLGKIIDERKIAPVQEDKLPMNWGDWLLAVLATGLFVICLIEAVKNEFIIGRALPISGAIWSILLLLIAVWRIRGHRRPIVA